MSGNITITLGRPDAAYVPDEPITGEVTWDLVQVPERIAVQVLWETSGKGTRDYGVAHERVWEMPSTSGRESFDFPGLEGPYSFSGKLITVSWVVEVTAEPKAGSAKQAFTLSPTGQEVRL